MAADDTGHELLPWSATGTLSRKDRRRFRRHLDRCIACRDELEVVLELHRRVRSGAEIRDGAHPPPSVLWALTRGSGALTVTVAPSVLAAARRHVATCPTCREEMAGLRPDPPAGL